MDSRMGRPVELFAVLLLLMVFVTDRVTGRVPDPPVFGSVSHFPSICYLPPDSALCAPSTSPNKGSSGEAVSDDLLVRYYFDATTAQCYPFGVQACGGNENRFETLASCQSYCRKSIKGG